MRHAAHPHQIVLEVIPTPGTERYNFIIKLFQLLKLLKLAGSQRLSAY